MSSTVSLIFDLVILGALGVTVFYCLKLSRQFNQMRADRKAFETLIQALNLASARAEASIHAFKEIAVGSGDVLQDKVNKSKALCEELEIMIQAGDNLANRLQALAEKSRRVTTNDMPEENVRAAPAEIQPRTRAERELLEALKAKQKS